MKHIQLRTIALLSLFFALMLTGCKKDKDDEPAALFSDEPRPAWTVPADYDYSSSMTAVIGIDLAAQFNQMASDFAVEPDDLLAAFIGNHCVGVATPQDGLFYLYMSGTEGAVTLRYWSAHYKNIFEAVDAFTFANDTHLGTVAEPFVPTLVEAK